MSAADHADARTTYKTWKINLQAVGNMHMHVNQHSLMKHACKANMQSRSLSEAWGGVLKSGSSVTWQQQDLQAHQLAAEA